MDTEILAEELARRLNRAEVALFRAEGDKVVLDGDYGFHVPLVVADAGSGRAEQVRSALARAGELADVPVIVGRHFGRPSLDALSAADANYMDDRSLRVRLKTPSILVALVGDVEPLPEPRVLAPSLSGAAGGVAIALLSGVEREWKVTDVADVARVSLGTAQHTLVALETEGLVARAGRGPATRRRVADPGGLLDRYARDAIADRRVLTRGFLIDDGAETTMRTACEHFPSLGFTGVAAAQIMAPHVTSVRTYEAWVTTPHRADHVLEKIGATFADEGANLMLFRGPRAVLVGGKRQNGIRLASAFRVYADALADPARGEEQAEYLRTTVIGF